jgi:hypothetical protein
VSNDPGHEVIRLVVVEEPPSHAAGALGVLLHTGAEGPKDRP